MLQPCRATRNSAKLAAMTTGGHTWLPGVFKQTDKRANEGVTNRPSRDWFALRKPADRNQLRVPHRRQVGNMDHRRALLDGHRDFGNRVMGGRKMSPVRVAGALFCCSHR